MNLMVNYKKNSIYIVIYQTRMNWLSPEVNQTVRAAMLIPPTIYNPKFDVTIKKKNNCQDVPFYEEKLIH